MHKILLPVDGSENALRAVDHVVRVAAEVGPVEVVLLNVQEPPMIYGEVQLYMSREKAEQFRVMASERVLADAASKLDQAGVRYTKAMLEGDVAHTIARHATESGCDAIVMGTRGMTVLGEAVLGSIAHKVVHYTRLPVTLVK